MAANNIIKKDQMERFEFFYKEFLDKEEKYAKHMSRFIKALGEAKKEFPEGSPQAKFLQDVIDSRTEVLNQSRLLIEKLTVVGYNVHEKAMLFQSAYTESFGDYDNAHKLPIAEHVRFLTEFSSFSNEDQKKIQDTLSAAGAQPFDSELIKSVQRIPRHELDLKEMAKCGEGFEKIGLRIKRVLNEINALQHLKIIEMQASRGKEDKGSVFKIGQGGKKAFVSNMKKVLYEKFIQELKVTSERGHTQIGNFANYISEIENQRKLYIDNIKKGKKKDKTDEEIDKFLDDLHREAVVLQSNSERTRINSKKRELGELKESEERLKRQVQSRMEARMDEVKTEIKGGEGKQKTIVNAFNAFEKERREAEEKPEGFVQSLGRRFDQTARVTGQAAQKFIRDLDPNTPKPPKAPKAPPLPPKKPKI